MMKTVEGSLDIFWENHTQPAATPRYRLIFCQYAGFKGGAMQPKYIVGESALKDYLLELNFASGNVEHWLATIKANAEVSINNVMMAEQHLAAFGQ